MNNNENRKNYYLVRSIPELVYNGIVGVGWVDFHFDKFTDASDVINQIIKDWSKKGLGKRANQIRRFFDISDGDIVVVPMPYTVAIGKATGGIFYDEKYINLDCANQRKIIFPRDRSGRIITIPRTAFREAFQRRLRVMGIAINSLNEFSDDIADALNAIDSGSDYSYINKVIEEKERNILEFKKKLLKNIQHGNTNLNTGGIGLELLVKELLAADGYDARVLSKQHFRSHADADILAERSDRFSVNKLLVQVKHHQGTSNLQGIEQLNEIFKAHPYEYDEYERILVSSATSHHQEKIQMKKILILK